MPSRCESDSDVRVADTQDAGLLAELGRATFMEAFKGRIADRDLTAFADKRFGLSRQRAELDEPGTVFFIALRDGVAFGYAKLCESVPPSCIPSPHAVELERLYLFARWHGQGVADALMDACLAEARRKAYQAVWLDVWDENLRALAFYRRYLFTLAGERAYLVATEEQRHLLMYRALGAEQPGRTCTSHGAEENGL